MFGTLGGPELFLIMVVALIVFGPRKLPELGRSLGKMMAEFRKASSDFQRTIEDEVDADRFKGDRQMTAPAAPVSTSEPQATAPADTVARPPDATPIEPK
jgi:Tat protein translocase TatB subunit